VHAVQALTAVALLDVLGIVRAHWVGNSQGGQSAKVAAITYPERVGSSAASNSSARSRSIDITSTSFAASGA